MFAQLPSLAPEWRLFVITGFLGGLTTFSTFSAEVVAALGKRAERRLGLQTIALDSIVGTVDRDRDFDRSFRPTSRRSRARRPAPDGGR